MPPPPSFGHGGPGAIHVNDWQGPFASPLDYDDPLAGPGDPLAAFVDGPVQSKNKRSKDKTKGLSSDRVEPRLKGYMLEKIKPQSGQESTWARVGKREMHVDDAKLAALVKAHRLRTRAGPEVEFGVLSSNQQGSVNRLIEQHNLKEKNTSAEWVLADVQRLGDSIWGRRLETKKMRVILKRQDKDVTQTGGRSTRQPTSQYSPGEIIDLSEPLVTKKDKDFVGGKKSKKHQQPYDDDLQPIDEPYERAGGQWNHHDPVQHVRDDQHYQNYRHQPQQPIYAEPIQQPMGPQLADPLGYPPQHDMQMPMVPPPQQYPQPYPVPQNPFTPNPDVMNPGQYDQPLWQGDQYLPSARVQTPLGHRRRSSSARRLRKLETGLESVQRKIEDLDLNSDSSDGHRDRDSIFTDPRSGGTRTPLSSLPSEDMFPRGDYNDRKRPKDRNRRGESRSKRYRDEARERRYRDERVELQPHYTNRSRREVRYNAISPHREPRYVDDSRDIPHSPIRDREYYADTRPRFEPAYERASRPRLHRSQTYDDYPMSRSAVEPRYLPSTPALLQRRLTDYPSEGHQYADYDEQHRSRRRRDSFGGRPQDLDPEYEAFQARKAFASAAPRDDVRYARRHTAAEPLGGYYS